MSQPGYQANQLSKLDLFNPETQDILLYTLVLSKNLLNAGKARHINKTYPGIVSMYAGGESKAVFWTIHLEKATKLTTFTGHILCFKVFCSLTFQCASTQAFIFNLVSPYSA